MNTPKDLIIKKVESEINQTVSSLSRIVKGEGNEVYEIKLSNAQDIIVKINHEGNLTQFLREKWSIEKCLEESILVPKVLSISEINISGARRPLMIQEKIEGEILSEILQITEPSNSKLLKNLLFQAGGVLAKIHKVSTYGFGELNDFGHGEFETLEKQMLEKSLHLKSFLRVAKELRLDPNVFINSVQVLIDNKSQYSLKNSVLSSNDFAPKHLFFNNKFFNGIIDFGISQGAHPIMDFANWDLWFGKDFPIDLLLSGYSDPDLIKNNFKMFNLCKIHKSLNIIDWYGNHDPGGSHSIPSIYEQLNKAVNLLYE